VTPIRGALRRGAWPALAAVVVVMLAGCSARATLTVTVRGDGSGSLALRVVLDPEAVRAAEGDGTPLTTRVRLTDLHQAGWSVSRWTAAKDGSASITLTRPFRSPGDVAVLARQLSGPTGPLPALAASRDPAWLGAAHTLTVHGVVNLHDAQPGVASDADLLRNLTGQHVDLAGIETELAGQLRTGVSLRVVVAVPGRRQVVTPRAGAHATIAASGTSLDLPRIVLATAALVLIVLASVSWRRGSRARTRRRRRSRRATTG
jgi:hypothetical protein